MELEARLTKAEMAAINRRANALAQDMWRIYRDRLVAWAAAQKLTGSGVITDELLTAVAPDVRASVLREEKPF